MVVVVVVGVVVVVVAVVVVVVVVVEVVAVVVKVAEAAAEVRGVLNRLWSGPIRIRLPSIAQLAHGSGVCVVLAGELRACTNIASRRRGRRLGVGVGCSVRAERQTAKPHHNHTDSNSFPPIMVLSPLFF